jgi:hypothetical protein
MLSDRAQNCEHSRIANGPQKSPIENLNGPIGSEHARPAFFRRDHLSETSNTCPSNKDQRSASLKGSELQKLRPFKGSLSDYTGVASANKQTALTGIQETAEKLNTKFPLAPLHSSLAPSPSLKLFLVFYSEIDPGKRPISIPFLSLYSPLRFSICSSASPRLKLAGLVRRPQPRFLSVD